MKHSLAGVELKSLLVLEQLMRSNSVVETAKLLAMQQSTVTYHLNKLRKHFDDPLFIPSGRGLEASKKALELKEPLTAVITQLEGVVHNRPLDLSAVKGHFKIAMQDLAAFHMIPKLVNHLHDVAPGVVIEASLWTENTERELINGELDLVFNTVSHQSPHFYGTQVGQLPMCVIYHHSHPLAKGKWKTQEIFDYPHVNISPYTENQKAVDQFAAKLNKKRNIVAASTSYHLLTLLLENSDRVSIVSSAVTSVINNDISIQATVIDELDPIALHCYWHQRNDSDGLHKFVRETLIEMCRDELKSVAS